ncbi:MAG: N-methyl-L-tryptophan oxidase [Verrucomicrobiota bacterium]
MKTVFDVIVLGLGAMGSASACHLARAGKRVLGLDRFTPPHVFGSSHGQTRIIREAYLEHPAYVPLIQRAYDLWHELESEAGRQLFLRTGGLMIGKPESAVVAGAKRSAEGHNLRHEILSAGEVKQRFPALVPGEEMIAVWEPRAGILFPEACVESHLMLARRYGATLRFNEPVTRWEPDGDGVRVFTADSVFLGSHLVLAAGPWIRSLLFDVNFPFSVERQIQFWFEPCSNHEQFGPERCPIHIWEQGPGGFFYGFPDLGNGVKVARHHEGELTDPEKLRRDVEPEEIDSMRELLRRFLPQAGGALRSTAVCMYTNMPDFHFFIDHHPRHRQVLIVSPCSGHGFKFSSVIGEIVGELIGEGRSRLDLSLFRRR